MLLGLIEFTWICMMKNRIFGLNCGVKLSRLQSWARLVMVIGSAGWIAGTAVGQTTLIEAVGRRGHVYDASREMLFISMSDGTVARYHLPSATLQTPIQVGQVLNGLDLAPDGAALYVTEDTPGNASAVLYKVDLDTEVVSSIRYPLYLQQEAGGWDISIAANGLGFLTTQYAGAGKLPVRELDVRDDSLRIRDDIPRPGGWVAQDTNLARNASGSRLFFNESRLSSGPVFFYDSGTDGFSDFMSTTHSSTSPISAVSRDGDLFAQELAGNISIRDGDLGEVRSLLNFDGGVVFSPVADVLYVGDEHRDEIVAFDTQSWDELYRVSAGADLEASFALGTGVMSITGDGKTLFVSVAGGVQRIELVAPMSLVIEPFPLVAGERGEVLISSGKPNAKTFVVYGQNLGKTFVPVLNVELDIQQPRLWGGAMVSDENGALVREFTVPRLRFAEIYLYVQGVQFELKSNVFETLILR